MSPAFPARRRADHFNSLVEASSTGVGGPGPVDDRLELVAALRAVAPVAARPEFVGRLREQLMAAAADELAAPARTSSPAPSLAPPLRHTGRDLVKDPAGPRPTRRRERRLAVAVGGFAVLTATTSMAIAAQSALPGQSLYPVKRALEDVHTDISVGDDAKGSTMLHHASGRLDEVDALTRSDDHDPVAIASTLTTFALQAQQASSLLLADYAQTGDETSIEELRDFTATSMRTLGQLASQVPPQVRAALTSAARTLFAIDTAALAACPGCRAAAIPAVPSLLSGGVLAGTTHTVTGTGRPTTTTPSARPTASSSPDSSPTTAAPSPSSSSSSTPPDPVLPSSGLPLTTPLSDPSPSATASPSGSTSNGSTSSGSSSGTHRHHHPIKLPGLGQGSGSGSSGDGSGGGQSLPAAIASTIGQVIGGLHHH